MFDDSELKRIADALEEILRLVKKDQEDSAARQRQRDEQATRNTNGPGLPGPRALAGGPGPKLQATSGKLQAPSYKLDKTTL